MRTSGAQAVALEASSHGIAEGRLADIDINIAVLTNVGRDHLDYHETEAAYHNAKAKLFGWSSLTAKVVNADDSLGQRLIADAMGDTDAQLHVYSTAASTPSRADYHTRHISLNSEGMVFELHDGAVSHNVTTPLYGRFNVDNLLACYAVLKACGIAASESITALQNLARVPGRMEPFVEGSQPTVIVDYAHTPLALSAAVQAVREHTQGDVWVVFGCGGDRDRGKRVLMAQAAEAADHVIVTDDNPRTEKAAVIRSEIISGFNRPAGVLEIGDRESAIQYAIRHAQPDDVVLVAGKGHEDYQIVGHQVLEFSDRAAVSRLLREAS